MLRVRLCCVFIGPFILFWPYLSYNSSQFKFSSLSILDHLPYNSYNWEKAKKGFDPFLLIHLHSSWSFGSSNWCNSSIIRKAKMKKCPYCKTCFTPHVKVGARQKTCGSPECKKALKSENNKRWRQRNADCCQNDYPRVKEWLDQNPGYLKKYRQGHQD